MATGSSFFSYFHITPLNYLIFLALSLLLYLGYLLLPRGLRAQYFGDGLRRRHRRRRTTRIGRWRGRGQTTSSSTAIDNRGVLPPPVDILESIYANSHSFSPDNVLGGHRLDFLFAGTTTPASQTTITTTTNWTNDPGSSSKIDDCSYLTPSVRDDRHEHQRPHDDMSPSSSLSREIEEVLRYPPGLMFVAHGTRCPPRPVWITLHHDDHRPPPPSEYRNRLTWRAELKRHRTTTTTTTPPSSSPSPSSERRLGNLRMVELHDVLGIELGKLTTALRRVQTAGRSRDVDCFSLLTRNGTLDLECVGLDGSTSAIASAEEVRVAFVTCLARAMSSRGLRLDGLSPRERIASITTWSTTTSGPSLQSKLQGLSGGAPPSTSTATPMEGRTVHSGMMSKISTVSF